MTDSHAQKAKPFVALVLVAAIATLAIGLANRSVASESPAVTERFSVLEEATPDTVEEISRQASEWVQGIEGGPAGSGGLAAIGTARTPGGDVTVAAVGESVCAADFGRGLGTCGREEAVARGEAFVARPDGCDAYEVMGMVPDGVDSLGADVGADGSPDLRVDVSDNVYRIVLPAVRTVLRAAGGAVAVELPLDWYREENAAC